MQRSWVISTVRNICKLSFSGGKYQTTAVASHSKQLVHKFVSIRLTSLSSAHVIVFDSALQAKVTNLYRELTVTSDNKLLSHMQSRIKLTTFCFIGVIATIVVAVTQPTRVCASSVLAQKCTFLTCPYSTNNKITASNQINVIQYHWQ